MSASRGHTLHICTCLPLTGGKGTVLQCCCPAPWAWVRNTRFGGQHSARNRHMLSCVSLAVHSCFICMHTAPRLPYSSSLAEAHSRQALTLSCTCAMRRRVQPDWAQPARQDARMHHGQGRCQHARPHPDSVKRIAVILRPYRCYVGLGDLGGSQCHPHKQERPKERVNKGKGTHRGWGRCRHARPRP